MNIAYFITDHGYGHATRAAAVMQALMARIANIHFQVFTQAPAWLLEDSLGPGHVTYHAWLTDAGMAQDGPLQENLEATAARVKSFVPFAPGTVDCLAEILDRHRCRCVLCDISPLGIAAAHRAGIPAVLIENFTWDWIYAGYPQLADALAEEIAFLKATFTSADVHIQAQPMCRPDAAADLVTPPIARASRQAAALTRRQLGLPAGAAAVLLTLGGVPLDRPIDHLLPRREGLYWILPDPSVRSVRSADAVLHLPPRSGFFHPDLIRASDAVVGKLGYSTLAEVYNESKPLGFIPRAEFPEMAALGKFAQEVVGGVRIPVERFERGDWADLLAVLLNASVPVSDRDNGAEVAADRIGGLLVGP